jgi:hypothetical protein
MPQRTRENVSQLIGGTTVAVALLISAGWALRGDTYAFFGEHRPGTYLSVGILLASGVRCLRLWRELAARPLRLGWFWLGLLLLFAGLDDLLRLHERADHAVNSLLGTDPNGRGDMIDDLLVAAYALPAVWICGVWLRNYVLRLRWSMWLFATAAVPFVVMVFCDLGLAGHVAYVIEETLEETSKLYAGALILAAVQAVAEDPLHRRLARAAVPAAGRIGSVVPAGCAAIRRQRLACRAREPEETNSRSA